MQTEVPRCRMAADWRGHKEDTVREDFDRRWQELAQEVLTGMKEWRLRHPRATLKEIEVALDERLGRLRARMLEDAALASAAAQWEEAESTERPACPQCGQALGVRGVRGERRLQTHGGQEIVLQREYGVCSAGGAELFPPG
jgi:hypothetical protein